VHGAAGVGHHGRHAQFGEHVRGRLHLGGPAHRVPGGAIHDPPHAVRVRAGQFGDDMLVQPLLLAGGAGGLKRLDDGRRHALVEHAAQQLLGRREPGGPGQHLDAGPQRGQHAGVGFGAVAAGQHGDA
jgi:hypothetical protein